MKILQNVAVYISKKKNKKNTEGWGLVNNVFNIIIIIIWLDYSFNTVFLNRGASEKGNQDSHCLGKTDEQVLF